MGTDGVSWSGSPDAAASETGSNLNFSSSFVYPEYSLWSCGRFPRSLRAGIRDREATDFYPASGYRTSSSGGLFYVGSDGYTWSSAALTASSTLASSLHFYSSHVGPESSDNRASGFPVRCVPDNKSGFR